MSVESIILVTFFVNACFHIFMYSRIIQLQSLIRDLQTKITFQKCDQENVAESLTARLQDATRQFSIPLRNK